jgi:hypothetical protein
MIVVFCHIIVKDNYSLELSTKQNLRTINLDIDKKLVIYHFDEYPIFGTVSGTSID